MNNKFIDVYSVVITSEPIGYYVSTTNPLPDRQSCWRQLFTYDTLSDAMAFVEEHHDKLGWQYMILKGWRYNNK